MVNADEAKKALENFINKTPYLKQNVKGNIKLVETLYDQDDTIIAYYFETVKSNEPGYFIVSAVKTLDPILEYGIGGTLQEKFKNKKVSDRSYYFGLNGLLFGKDSNEIKQKFKSSKEKSLKEMKDNGLEDTEKYQMLSKLELKSLKKGDKTSPGWDNLLNDSQNVVTLASSSIRELAVDHISQRSNGIKNQNSACGPTAAAMIVDFYHDVMHYAVRDNAYYGSWAALVNHLYNEMGTTIFGTPLGDWRSGMYKHVTHDSSAWTQHSVIGTLGQDDYIAAIDSNDPVGIFWNEYPWSNVDAENKWHWTTGYAYNKNGSYTGDLHIGYLDPWDTSRVERWIDYTAQDDYFYLAWMR